MESIDFDKALKALERRLNKNFNRLHKELAEIKSGIKGMTGSDGYVKFMENKIALEKYEAELNEFFDYSKVAPELAKLMKEVYKKR